MEDGILISGLRFLILKRELVWAAMQTHIYLMLMGSLLAIMIGVPLGIITQRVQFLKRPVMGTVSVIYTIPILAKFGLLIPLVGIGDEAALITMVVSGLLPILQNTYTGIDEVSPHLKEAARGMGAGEFQLLRKVEIPLAFPVILAGIRTTVVLNISIATFAVFVGAGGMGTIIMQGMRTYNSGMLLAGTFLVALLAILVDRSLGMLQARVMRHVS